MADWPRVAVKSLCSLIVDCVNRTAPVIERETPFRMIRTTNVRDGRIDLSTCRYVDEPTYQRWTRRAKLLDGDVILTREAPIGEVGYIQKLGPVFLGQRLMQFRPDPKKVVPRYLYYAFRSPDLQHQFGTHDGSGSVVSHIRVADCHEFKVSVPPIDHQQNVVTLLGSLDDKIELNRQMNETLEAMAQEVFRDWFVDFGPTRRKLEGVTDPLTIMGGLVQDTERAQALADLFPAAVGDDGLPEGWSETTLEQYASLNPESWGVKTAPDQVEYVDLANTKWGTIESTSVYSWENAPSRARRILRYGDTIIGTVRPGNGSYAFVGRNGLTASTGFAVLRPKQCAFNEFVNCAATSVENIQRLEMLADGGAYPAVKPEVVQATAVPVVAAEVLAAFSDYAAPMFQQVENSKEENLTLAATRDLLLPKLMSGEIRLAEAEDLMEAAQ